MVVVVPIGGAYAEFVCLRESELVAVPPGVDAAKGVSLILNYITAYQMLHRSEKVRPGQRVLIHGASGGVGTALFPSTAAQPSGREPSYVQSDALFSEKSLGKSRAEGNMKYISCVAAHNRAYT